MLNQLPRGLFEANGFEYFQEEIYERERRKLKDTQGCGRATKTGRSVRHINGSNN